MARHTSSFVRHEDDITEGSCLIEGFELFPGAHRLPSKNGGISNASYFRRHRFVGVALYMIGGNNGRQILTATLTLCIVISTRMCPCSCNGTCLYSVTEGSAPTGSRRVRQYSAQEMNNHFNASEGFRLLLASSSPIAILKVALA